MGPVQSRMEFQALEGSCVTEQLLNDSWKKPTVGKLRGGSPFMDVLMLFLMELGALHFFRGHKLVCTWQEMSVPAQL